MDARSHDKGLEVPLDVARPGVRAWLSVAAAMIAVAAALLLTLLLGSGPASAQGQEGDSGICGRTQIVRDAILRKLPDVSDCAAVTGAHLAGITGEIIMLDNGTITLQDGDFAGLSNLDVLYLHHNDLSSIPEDALDGLTGLEELYLYNNTLTTLPSDVFDDLSNLEKLELSYNSMTSLPADVFEGLPDLEELNLRNNGLTALPEGLFDGLSSLTDLSLNSNSLTSLPGGVFEGLSGLEDLRLGGNPGSPFAFTAELESTHDGVLVKVSEGAPFDITVALSADGGTLASSSVTVGAGSTTSSAVTVTPAGSNAVTVSVDSAAFPAGGPHFSEGVRTAAGDSLTVAEFCARTLAVQTAVLAELDDVSNCVNVTDSHLAGISPLLFEVAGVSSLKSGDFDGLSSLTFLEVSYVSRDAAVDERTMPEDVFEGLDSLEILDLSGNDLTSLPEDIFEGLTTLDKLILSSNDLTTLPEGIFDGLTAMWKLKLDFNDLGSLPADVFDGLTSLRELWLYFNELSSLPADVFDGLSSLTHLFLDGNGVSALPDGVFDGIPNVERLHIDGNDLSSLPDGVFGGLTELDWLELHDNPGSPFTLTAELESTDGGVVVKVSEGAPFDIAVTLSAEGATLSSTTVTVAAGSTTGSEVTVTPVGTSDATVSVDSAAFGGGTTRNGIQTGTGSDLTIAVNSPATGAPTISGTAQVGHTLTADTSAIRDADGLTDVDYSYQWLSGSDTPIAGATGSTYVLQSSDATNTIKVRVSFKDDEGHDETLTSAATAAVAPGGL